LHSVPRIATIHRFPFAISHAFARFHLRFYHLLLWLPRRRPCSAAFAGLPHAGAVPLRYRYRLPVHFLPVEFCRSLPLTIAHVLRRLLPATYACSAIVVRWFTTVPRPTTYEPITARYHSILHRFHGPHQAFHYRTTTLLPTGVHIRPTFYRCSFIPILPFLPITGVLLFDFVYILFISIRRCSDIRLLPVIHSDWFILIFIRFDLERSILCIPYRYHSGILLHLLILHAFCSISFPCISISVLMMPVDHHFIQMHYTTTTDSLHSTFYIHSTIRFTRLIVCSTCIYCVRFTCRLDTVHVITAVLPIPAVRFSLQLHVDGVPFTVFTVAGYLTVYHRYHHPSTPHTPLFLIRTAFTCSLPFAVYSLPPPVLPYAAILFAVTTVVLPFVSVFHLPLPPPLPFDFHRWVRSTEFVHYVSTYYRTDVPPLPSDLMPPRLLGTCCWRSLPVTVVRCSICRFSAPHPVVSPVYRVTPLPFVFHSCVHSVLFYTFYAVYRSRSGRCVFPVADAHSPPAVDTLFTISLPDVCITRFLYRYYVLFSTFGCYVCTYIPFYVITFHRFCLPTQPHYTYRYSCTRSCYISFWAMRYTFRSDYLPCISCHLGRWLRWVRSVHTVQTTTYRCLRSPRSVPFPFPLHTTCTPLLFLPTLPPGYHSIHFVISHLPTFITVLLFVPNTFPTYTPRLFIPIPFSHSSIRWSDSLFPTILLFRTLFVRLPHLILRYVYYTILFHSFIVTHVCSVRWPFRSLWYIHYSTGVHVRSSLLTFHFLFVLPVTAPILPHFVCVYVYSTGDYVPIPFYLFWWWALFPTLSDATWYRFPCQFIPFPVVYRYSTCSSDVVDAIRCCSCCWPSDFTTVTCYIDSTIPRLPLYFHSVDFTLFCFWHYRFNTCYRYYVVHFLPLRWFRFNYHYHSTVDVFTLNTFTTPGYVRAFVPFYNSSVTTFALPPGVLYVTLILPTPVSTLPLPVTTFPTYVYTRLSFWFRWIDFTARSHTFCRSDTFCISFTCTAILLTVTFFVVHWFCSDLFGAIPLYHTTSACSTVPLPLVCLCFTVHVTVVTVSLLPLVLITTVITAFRPIHVYTGLHHLRWVPLRVPPFLHRSVDNHLRYYGAYLYLLLSFRPYRYLVFWALPFVLILRFCSCVIYVWYSRCALRYRFRYVILRFSMDTLPDTLGTALPRSAYRADYIHIRDYRLPLPPEYYCSVRYRHSALFRFVCSCCSLRSDVPTFYLLTTIRCLPEKGCVILEFCCDFHLYCVRFLPILFLLRFCCTFYDSVRSTVWAFTPTAVATYWFVFTVITTHLTVSPAIPVIVVPQDDFYSPFHHRQTDSLVLHFRSWFVLFSLLFTSIHSRYLPVLISRSLPHLRLRCVTYTDTPVFPFVTYRFRLFVHLRCCFLLHTHHYCWTLFCLNFMPHVPLLHTIYLLTYVYRFYLPAPLHVLLPCST